MITTAEQAVKDAAIQAGIKAAFPMINIAVDHVLSEMQKAGYECVPESVIMALFVAASGICKHQKYDLQTTAVALGQAWNLAELPVTAPADSATNVPEGQD